MIRAFRIFKSSRAESAFLGIGAKRSGGRWNMKSHAVAYCSESLSLAVLEILVNMEDYSELEDLFSFASVEIPPSLIETVPTDSLPKGWDSKVATAASKSFGTDWLLNGRSAVLRVPSAVVPSEWNYLLNPAHPDFIKLKTSAAKPFSMDARLHKGIL